MALLPFMQQPQNQNLSMALPTMGGQNAAPSEAFVWGQGGARLTPDQLAAQRAIAEQLMQSDFSPVGSVWEGLGRVANNVTGALDARSIGRKEEAAAARDAEIAQMLLGGDAAAVNQALLDPTLSPTTRQFAEMQYGRLNPKPQAPTEWERTLKASGIVPGSPQWVAAMGQKVQNTLDPFTNVVAGGNTIMGRQSMVEQALGGGGGAPAAGLPTAPVGRLTPITGGPTPQASGGF